jgi:hypothetical protein
MKPKRNDLSFEIADSMTEYLLDHVHNILWAKALFKQIPAYIVNYIQEQTAQCSSFYFMNYDRREDDSYLRDAEEDKEGTFEPRPAACDTYVKCTAIKYLDPSLVDLDRSTFNLED